MTLHKLTVAVGVILLAACSSPPQAPTVDDSRKRPVNVSQAVDLQMCRTELSAAKIVLTEALAEQQHLAAVASAPPPAAPPPVLTVKSNQVFVITFAFASADLTVPADQRARLLQQARLAKFIVIRGRTDSTADSMSETRLARRRAEAAYDFLIGQVGLPPEGIRLSWQGAGDPMRAAEKAGDHHANRRVEIELYPVKPSIDVLARSAS